MKLLLKQVKVVDPTSKYNGRKVDILIEKGVVKKIAKSITKPSQTKVWQKENVHISPGWLDIGTQIGEPGYEQRETIETVTAAAIAGGYTGLAPFPNTHPPLQSKADLQALFAITNDLPIAFYPIAALTKNNAGKEITEMIELTEAGAIAFSDGAGYVQDAGVLKRGLEYANAVNGLIINQANHYPDEGGMIHEGEVSVKLGLKGITDYSETTAVKRDIELAAYTKSNLLVHNVSGATTLPILKQANKGKRVFSSVSYLNLICNEEHVDDFNTQYKVLPPLRSSTDRNALVKAVKNGIIQVITSNHTPIEDEKKHLEFEQSAYGATGLETCFAALCTHIKDALELEDIITALAIQPRSILGLHVPIVDIEEAADYTLFDPDLPWTYRKEDILSKSKNNPFVDAAFTGKALGIIRDEVLVEI